MGLTENEQQTLDTITRGLNVIIADLESESPRVGREFFNAHLAMTRALLKIAKLVAGGDATTALATLNVFAIEYGRFQARCAAKNN